MYIDKPLRHFLDKLAGKSPEPGGGSVAALTGALGAAPREHGGKSHPRQGKVQGRPAAG